MERLITTQAIVLRRLDFQEADRIINVLTPDHGKLGLMVKGARRMRSKLAGGIELFCRSEITYIPGNKDLQTLVSSRVLESFSQIVKQIDRTMCGYELLKLMHLSTEDRLDSEYFSVMLLALRSLDDFTIDVRLIDMWFRMQLLRLSGQTPNLETEQSGTKLVDGEAYSFSFEDMAFYRHNNGAYRAPIIKFLRLGFAAHRPKTLQKITGINELLPITTSLVRDMHRYN